LVTRINEIVAIQVYRKLTHTDRYLDFRFRHDKRHKTGTVSNLLNRARKLQSTTEVIFDELKHVTSALKRGVNRGIQIRRPVPFFAKSVDSPIVLFKSERKTTSGNRSILVNVNAIVNFIQTVKRATHLSKNELRSKKEIIWINSLTY